MIQVRSASATNAGEGWSPQARSQTEERQHDDQRVELPQQCHGRRLDITEPDPPVCERLSNG